MSEVKVNKISPRSGTAFTLGDSGDTFTVPTGAGLTVTDEVKTNKISPATGVAFALGDSGDTFTVPSGATIVNSGTATGFGDSLRPNVNPLIINGDMAISQRATSAASLTSSDYNTLDRYRCVIVTAGTWTQSQDTDVPTGSGFATSMKWDCTTADASLGASDLITIQQFVEGQNVQYLKKGTSDAVPITLSFWVKSVLTGTYICEIGDSDNSRSISQAYTISDASTWEYKTLNFPGDTTGAFTNDNGASLTVQFCLGAGTDYTSGSLATSWGTTTTANRYVGQVNLANSTSNNFWITGIQLEAGEFTSSTLPPFQHESFGNNLERCRRYCVVLGDAPGGSAYDTFFKGTIGHYYNTTDFYPNFDYPIVMRGVPGVTWSTTSSGFGSVESAGSAHANTSTGTNWTGNTNMNFRVSTSSATAGDGGSLDFLTSQYVLLSAEL